MLISSTTVSEHSSNPSLNSGTADARLVEESVEIVVGSGRRLAFKPRADLLELAFEAVAGLIYDWDIITGDCHRSPGLPRLLGVHPGDDEPTIAWWSSRIHPEDRARVLEEWNLATRDSLDIVESRYRVRHADGRWIWIDDRLRVVRDHAGNAIRGVGAARDVTTEIENLSAIAELTQHRAEALAQLSALFEAVPVGLTLLDREGRYRMINERLAEINGISVESHIGHTPSEILPDLSSTVEPILKRVLVNGERIEDVIIEGETPKAPGIIRVWTGGYFPVPGPDGTPIGVGIIVKEITEQREAEEALLRSEASLRTLTDAMPQLVWRCNARKSWTFVSSQWEACTGQTVAEAAGTGWLAAVHPDDRQRLLDCWNACVARPNVFECDHRIRMADGSFRWYMSRAVPVSTRGGSDQTWIGTSTDVEERKRAEDVLARDHAALERLVTERSASLQRLHQRLRFEERLKMMGGLAAGLGHDLGNLLTPMRMRLDALAEVFTRIAPSHAAAEEGADDIAALRDSLEYAQRLAEGLRLLAVDPTRARHDECTNIGNWWLKTAPLLRSLLPVEVELRGNDLAGCDPIAMSPSTLLQIVFNLVQNAGEALRYTPCGSVVVEGSCNQDAVSLTIRDNGPGMPPEVRDRCMEPFVTTKSSSSSGGMGLALVRTFVASAGGSICVDSTVGKGTAFTIVIPLAKNAKAAAKSPARTALISVKSPALRAAVEHELKSLAFEIAPSSTDGAGHSTEPASTNAEPDALIDVEIAESVSMTSGRASNLILLRDPWDSAMPPNVHAIGNTFSASMLRVVLREISATPAC